MNVLMFKHELLNFAFKERALYLIQNLSLNKKHKNY